MQKKCMLITGVSGLLGNNLAFCLKDAYDIVGVYHAHELKIDGIRMAGADLTSDADVHKLIKEFNPQVIIHCAAQTDVDICEEYPQEAKNINVLGTQNLIRNLNGSEAKLVYISTDLVYDGTKEIFSEDDPVNPLNYYGVTKCEAEKEVSKYQNALILRTNFFGWNIQNKYSLGEWVIHELGRKKEMVGFIDCNFSSIYTFELAKILDLAIRKNLSGVYNCASSSSISKYEFASEIARRLNFEKGLIKPISIDDFGFRAKRGKKLSLNTNKLAGDLSIDIPSISYSIDRFVEDFKTGVPDKIKSNGYLKGIDLVDLDIIPYGRQCIEDDDVAAVVEVLKSGSVTQGPKIAEFESALCQKTGASFAVAVNSGTSALHIACLAAGIGPGDEVVTSPNTFVASANCAVFCGGKPVFADIDPRTYNISPQEIEKKINQRTRAVIPIHFAGQSCDMQAIQEIVKTAERKHGHKIYIIEDACHALGSRYKETKVGSCAYSQMAVMSFHPVKHITTGEGGAVLTNDRELERKLRYFRSHGITSTPDEFFYKENAFEKGKQEGAVAVRKLWYYEQNCLGYNYRITEIQCALGLSQLKKLDKFRQRRREIVLEYHNAFRDVEQLIIPYEESFCDSNLHLYVLQLDFEKMGVSRAQAMIELKKRGIQTQVHYIPVYTQPFYRKNFGTRWGECPAAEQYYQKCLSIPLYPLMTDKDVARVISEIIQLCTAREGTFGKKGGNFISPDEFNQKKVNKESIGHSMIAKMSLGTVQFGQDYGIANTRGKVQKSEVFEILDYAHSVGIDCLDTAFAYGESESVIGEYWKEKHDRFKIVSKLPPFDQYKPGKVEEVFEQSLKRLGAQRLYGYLVHQFHDLQINSPLWRDLEGLKKNGRVKKIGVSLYSPDELFFLLEKEIELDIIQVPYSIFDRRFAGYFDLLYKKGIEIQTRSVFLQGLAFLRLNDLPTPLKMVRPQLENLRRIAYEQEISIEALCLNFVLANPSIQRVVIGVDSLRHLQKNVASLTCLDRVKEIYGQLNEIQVEREDILLPYRWGMTEV